MLKRFLKSTVAVGFGHVIARLGSLILLPLFLRSWSVGLYGEYLALTAAAAYLAALDFGVQMAAVNRLTQTYARQDTGEYRSCQNSALALYLIISGAATLAALLCILLLPIPEWLKLRETLPGTAKVVLVLAALYVSWSMPARLITSVYQTTGNLARSQWIGNIQQVGCIIVAGALLLCGAGMIAIASVQLVLLAGTTLFVLIDRRRKFPELSLGLANASFSAVRSLLRPSALFMLLLLGNFLTIQGGVLIASAALGGVAVAVFSISRTLVAMVREGLYSLQVALWPEFARLETLNNKEQLRALHRIVVALSSALAIAVCTALWFEGVAVIDFWLRGRLPTDSVLLRMLLVYTALQAPWVASSSIATATNRHRVYAVAYIAASAIFVIVAISLVPRFGLPALAIGLLAGEALACYHWVIRSTCQIVGEAYGRFAVRLWTGYASVAALSFGAAWTAHTLYDGPVLVRWILVGGCTLGTSLTAATLIWLTPSDRDRILNKLAPAIPWASARVSVARGQ